MFIQSIIIDDVMGFEVVIDNKDYYPQCTIMKNGTPWISGDLNKNPNIDMGNLQLLRDSAQYFVWEKLEEENGKF